MKHILILSGSPRKGGMRQNFSDFRFGYGGQCLLLPSGLEHGGMVCADGRRT